MTHASLNFDARNEADTEQLGRALATALAAGGVVALRGPLGAGKTRLVQAIAAASGVDRRDVVSPTFVLVHEYTGQRPILHLDAYRLRDEDEFWQLGVDEFLGPPNLVFVEWADRVETCLPDERLEITINVLEAEARRFVVEGRGERHAAVVEQVRAALSRETC